MVVLLALSALGPVSCDAGRGEAPLPLGSASAAATAGATGTPAGDGPPTGGEDPTRSRSPAPWGERLGGPDGDAVPEGAFTLPNVRGCVADCVQQNQHRGVAAEQIDADCRAECKAACTSQCDAGSADAKQACHKACERQVERLR